MQLKHPLTPCLWFDTQAEDAAKFYCSVFKNSQFGRSVTILIWAGKLTAGRLARS